MPQRPSIFSFSFAIAGATVAGIALGTYAYFSSKSSRCSIINYFKQKIGTSKSSVAALTSPNDWVSFEVVENVANTHNTRLITFKLPSNASKLGLTMTSCLLAKMKLPSGEYAFKPYTPISSEEEISKTRFFSLLVKEYPKGMLSKYICNLSKGEFVEMRGPIPKIDFEKKTTENEISGLEGVKRLAMIAGGTGITPMLQAADYILKNSSYLKILIISANDTKDDMLAIQQLNSLIKTYPDQVQVQHVLRQGGLETAITGVVTSTILRKLSVVPQETQKVFICGPPPMLTYLCGQKDKDKTQGPLDGILLELGYSADQVYKF